MFSSLFRLKRFNSPPVRSYIENTDAFCIAALTWTLNWPVFIVGKTFMNGSAFDTVFKAVGKLQGDILKEESTYTFCPQTLKQVN